MFRFILFLCICILSDSFSLAQNVGIDILAPLGKLHVKGSADISQLIIDANAIQGNGNPLIRLRNYTGLDLMWIHSDDSSNIFMGLKAGSANVIMPGGINNTFMGSHAGYSNTNGWDNTIVGANALFSNTTAGRNTAIGTNALFTQSFSSNQPWWHSFNVAVGYEALYYNQPTNTSNGYNNTAVGTRTLFYNTTGYSNTALGNNALTTNTTGSKNTAIGYNADVISDNLINASAFGYNAKVGASNALVLGGTGSDEVNVGIGTITPNARLEIVGQLKIVDGTQGAGKLLTSDSTGRASWQPPPPPPGMNEPSVRICCQRWMTKNLDVATYRNGDTIPQVTNAAEWAALTTGAYCYYNNDSTTYAATYGKLYNWYAVNDPRGLAPEGWYIPTDFEWITLGECLGGVLIAGGLLKEIGTTHWNFPNEGATDRSGFTGLPGGIREDDGTFHSIGLKAFWWSSTAVVTGTVRFHSLLHDSELFTNHYNSVATGYSVRCVRD